MQFNLFKKKEDEKIQGSGYGSNYASNPQTNSSNYLNNYLSNMSSSKLFSQPKPVTSPILTTQAMKQSLGIKQPTQIQGSGYTSNYASNPTNYKPPVTKQQEQAPQPQQPSMPSYISGYQNLAEQKKKLLADQLASQQGYLNKYYDKSGQASQQNIDALNRNLSQNKASFDKNIAMQQARTETQKQGIEDLWGEGQRQAAQTRQESEGRMRNKFAALGTTGSYGAGSYGQAQENVESDFNRYTQQGLRQKQDNMQEMDFALQQYELDARSKLDDLELQVTQAINQIAQNQALSELEKENALKELGFAYENAKLGVEEGMQGVYAQYDQALRDAETNSLSDVFMQTGVPQTEADYKYYVENKDKVDSMVGGGTQNSNQNKALGLVDSLLSGNVAAISGGFRPGSTPILNKIFGGGQEAAQWEGLKNLLALAGRGQLKGSGAVSDFEAKMLEKAALAGLDPTKQTEEQFYAGLKQLQNDLRAGGAVNQSQQVQRPPLSSFER